jgi:hypothetical protein
VSLDQQAVQDMLTTMLNDARHPTMLSQEQAKAQADAQVRMVNAQINLMPDQAKYAQEQELARINQETVRIRQAGEVQLAEQQTARTEAAAIGRTQQAALTGNNPNQVALLSGNPILRTAATITPADAVWVDAAKVAADILF